MTWLSFRAISQTISMRQLALDFMLPAIHYIEEFAKTEPGGK
jgi:hypothetical protein